MKARKILLIDGHPNAESFNSSLFDAYRRGLLSSGAEMQEIIIRDLRFSPNLQFGYQKRTELEPDLLAAWEKITWADHLVWIHPVWWGGLPAITKGFIDRLFLPGMAFRYRDNSVWWDKLLKGKTAHIITTLDQPAWFYWLTRGKPSVNQLKKSILEFCGVTPVRVTYFAPIRNTGKDVLEKWLVRAEAMGKKML